jgi:hypothetical protein
MVIGKAAQALPSAGGSRQQLEREKRTDAGDDLHKVEARALSRTYPAKGPGGRGTKGGRSSAHRSGAQRAAPPPRSGGFSLHFDPSESGMFVGADPDRRFGEGLVSLITGN